jgi:hypothetical protein
MKTLNINNNLYINLDNIDYMERLDSVEEVTIKDLKELIKFDFVKTKYKLVKKDFKIILYLNEKEFTDLTNFWFYNDFKVLPMSIIYEITYNNLILN